MQIAQNVRENCDIQANNSTIYNNCTVNNTYTCASPPTTGSKRRRKRKRKQEKRLNARNAESEENGSESDCSEGPNADGAYKEMNGSRRDRLEGLHCGHTKSDETGSDNDCSEGPNAEGACNEMNGSRRDRLEEIWKETIKKYGLGPFVTLTPPPPPLVREYLQKLIKQQDVEVVAKSIVGDVGRSARDRLYRHFEVLEKDVKDIRGRMRKEETVEDEVYQVLDHALRDPGNPKTREYLLRKLYERDENLARSFIEYLFKEMMNERKRDAGRNSAGASCHSPPICIPNAINYQTVRT